MYVRTYVDGYTLRNATWSGAKENINLLFEDEIEQILSILDDLAVNWDMTDLNDFFWFDTECWLEWIGFDDFETFYTERRKDFHLDE